MQKNNRLSSRMQLVKIEKFDHLFKELRVLEVLN